MTNTSRIPWPTLTTLHVPRRQQICSLFVSHKIRLLQTAHKRAIGVRKFHRSVEVLKKTSIHKTRRYAGTVQCSNTGHVLFVAT